MPPTSIRRAPTSPSTPSRRRRQVRLGAGDHAAGDRPRAARRQARGAHGARRRPAATRATSRSTATAHFSCARCIAQGGTSWWPSRPARSRCPTRASTWRCRPTRRCSRAWRGHRRARHTDGSAALRRRSASACPSTASCGRGRCGWRRRSAGSTSAAAPRALPPARLALPPGSVRFAIGHRPRHRLSLRRAKVPRSAAHRSKTRAGCTRLASPTAVGQSPQGRDDADGGVVAGGPREYPACAIAAPRCIPTRSAASGPSCAATR